MPCRWFDYRRAGDWRKGRRRVAGGGGRGRGAGGVTNVKNSERPTVAEAQPTKDAENEGGQWWDAAAGMGAEAGWVTRIAEGGGASAGHKTRQARGSPLACLNGRSRWFNASGSSRTGAGLLLLGGLLGSGLGLGRLLRSSFLGSSHDNDLRILFRDTRMPRSRTRNPHATDIRIVVTAG